MRSAPVYALLPGAREPLEAGVLYGGDDGAGRFVYSAAYRDSGHDPLDPKELRFTASPVGRRFPAEHRGGMPGVIADAVPDHWGTRILSITLGRELDPFDALVLAPDDAFGHLTVGDPALKKQPTEMDLGMLSGIIGGMESGSQEAEIVRQMLCPGTSLGGMKPKMTVLDGGVPWIAKFPERGDSPRAAYHEAAAMRMAIRLGIDAATVRVERLPEDRSVLLVKRFDRETGEDGTRGRIAAVSALTVMGPAAQQHFSPQRTYNHFFHRALEWVADGDRGLLGPKIWERIALNCLLANVDDHPRNHALLKSGGGWQLAPLFDMVPSTARQAKRALSMPYTAVDAGTGYQRTSAITAHNLVNAAPRFGLSAEDARAKIAGMGASILDQWGEIMAELGAPDTAITDTRVTLEWCGHLMDDTRDLHPAPGSAGRRGGGWKWVP